MSSSTEAVEEANTEDKKVVTKIVVCEDDGGTLELLCDHLTADGFETLAAPTAADALRLCQLGSPDLLLLDLCLPDSSGLDVLRQIREPDRTINKANPNLAVIIVSGRGSERDRVRGLTEGADGYVCKPFSYGELLARINAVLRQRRRADDPIVKAGEIEINRVDRTVKVGDRSVELSVKEFALLLALAEEPQKIHAKEDLLRSVWGYRSLGHTRTLEAHASRLRRKLDPDGTRNLIPNCWGVGYSVCVPESWKS